MTSARCIPCTKLSQACRFGEIDATDETGGISSPLSKGDCFTVDDTMVLYFFHRSFFYSSEQGFFASQWLCSISHTPSSCGNHKKQPNTTSTVQKALRSPSHNVHSVIQYTWAPSRAPQDHETAPSLSFTAAAGAADAANKGASLLALPSRPPHARPLILYDLIGCGNKHVLYSRENSVGGWGTTPFPHQQILSAPS